MSGVSMTADREKERKVLLETAEEGEEKAYRGS